MKQQFSGLILAGLMAAHCGQVMAANTGVKFANGVNAGNIQGSSLPEVSGCAASRVNPGIFWMHNDSGDSARIFAVSNTGVQKGIFNFSNASAADWEDIAVGPGPVAGQSYVYVGDIGDNGASRNSRQVYRVPEPKLGVTPSTIAAEKFTFNYPDGPRDAETLMVDSRTADVYVVSKRESSNRVYRFKAPLVNGQTYTGVEVARITISGLTGGDISADGSRILIRNGGQVYLWLRKDGETVGAALSRAPVLVPTASEPQGEAVCWDATGTDYYTTSEGGNKPFYHYKSLDGGTGSPDQPTSTNSLQINQTMKTGQRIVSSTGGYHFDIQGDGNMVTYSATGAVVWTANTTGKGGVSLQLQGDGNLVLRTTAGVAVWSSGTSGKSASYLILQSDGKLVLRNASGATVWSN